MDKILLVNGPNLNMLGTREPEKYGRARLIDIIEKMEGEAEKYGFKLMHYQSNSEGALVDFIQQEGPSAAGMVINAGAYTHTSIAIRDAILSVSLDFVEVHLSNIFKREEFRHHSYLSDIAIGMITGFGPDSYYLGIEAMSRYIKEQTGNKE